MRVFPGYGTGEVEISFKGQDYIDAALAYVDPELDLAVVKVPVADIPTEAIEAKLDCSDRSLNGLAVAAFGHPYGLTYSASRGIISKVRYYHGVDWVQTDAAINPGNSGGPLIALDTGNIVGINALTLEDTEGLSFAVPIKPVCKILSLLMAGADPSPPELPIVLQSIMSLRSISSLLLGWEANSQKRLCLVTGLLTLMDHQFPHPQH